MTRSVQYTARVDAVVYDSPATRDFTAQDWFDLALAALDQAGMSAAVQKDLRDIRSLDTRPWEEK